MSNMDYCKFQNTLADLVTCKDALEEFLGDGATTELARTELLAAKGLVAECGNIMLIVADALGFDLSDEDAFETVVDGADGALDYAQEQACIDREGAENEG